MLTTYAIKRCGLKVGREGEEQFEDGLLHVVAVELCIDFDGAKAGLSIL